VLVFHRDDAVITLCLDGASRRPDLAQIILRQRPEYPHPRLLSTLGKPNRIGP
jgi:hypothetical protein